MYQKQVGFGEAISMAFNKYCCFSGRASRSEYWFFTLFVFIVQALLGSGVNFADNLTLLGSLYGVFGLVVFLPSLGLTIRRLHDIGKGGGWIFINLIPLVGQIIFLIWTCKPSEIGDNRFGPMPNLVVA